MAKETILEELRAHYIEIDKDTLLYYLNKCFIDHGELYQKIIDLLDKDNLNRDRGSGGLGGELQPPTFWQNICLTTSVDRLLSHN